jgi:hypothetical protein
VHWSLDDWPRFYRMRMLREFIETISGRASVWFATHAEVAAHVTAPDPRPSAQAR